MYSETIKALRQAENKRLFTSPAIKGIKRGIYMGKLLDFYNQHRRLFLPQKHQNITGQENEKDRKMQRFLIYCESMQIYHTKGIRNKTVKDFFNSGEMLSKSVETRRKYFLVINSFFKRFYNKELNKNEIGIR